jgi:hypothetical protein
MDEQSYELLGAFSVEDFARLHSISRSTAYEEIGAGRLTARKFRSRTLVTAEDAQAMADQLAQIGTGRCPHG